MSSLPLQHNEINEPIVDRSVFSYSLSDVALLAIVFRLVHLNV